MAERVQSPAAGVFQRKLLQRFEGADAEVRFNTFFQRIARGYGVQQAALNLIEAFKFAFVARGLKVDSFSYWKTGTGENDSEAVASLRGKNSKGATVLIELVINARGISAKSEDGNITAEHKWRMLFAVPGVVGSLLNLSDANPFACFAVEAGTIASAGC